MIDEEIPFDELPLDIPPRTSLFRLVPFGIGTPEVESFAGWLTRLARAHRVSVRTLLLQVLPHEEGRYAAAGKSGRWRVRCNVLNVPGRILPPLAQTTGIYDLSSLSLERWFGCLSRLGLLRHRRAWCPECLREKPYERLLWTLRPVQMCSVHQLPLEEHCPFCGHSPPRLNLGSSLEICPQCRQGIAFSPKQSRDLSEWDAHVAKAVGSLVALEKPMRMNSPALIGEGIRNALPTWSQGEITRMLGVSDNRFALLRSRNKTLPLEFLCRVSFVLRVSVPSLLTGDPDTWTPASPRKGLWKQAQRLLVESDPLLRQCLEQLIDEGCPSLREASLRLGRSRTTLLRHFPEECSELLRRSGNRYAWRIPKVVETAPRLL
ncbi:TniQ protein [Verrucomicrobium sp. GAS474]|nr:TniQ protein [Verrucomicrobium sp. GAS474]